MIRVRTLFAAALGLGLLASAASAMSSEDAFSAAIDRINESAGKVAADQAKRSREKRADVTAPTCTPAQIDEAYAALPRCEASIKKAFGASVRDFKGALKKGFSRDGFSVVLMTTTDAFFYHEDCDSCAAIERCSLKDGSLSVFKTAHGAGCRDLAPFLGKDVAYSACPLRP